MLCLLFLVLCFQFPWRRGEDAVKPKPVQVPETNQTDALTTRKRKTKGIFFSCLLFMLWLFWLCFCCNCFSVVIVFWSCDCWNGRNIFVVIVSIVFVRLTVWIMFIIWYSLLSLFVCVYILNCLFSMCLIILIVFVLYVFIMLIVFVFLCFNCFWSLCFNYLNCCVFIAFIVFGRATVLILLIVLCYLV